MSPLTAPISLASGDSSSGSTSISSTKRLKPLMPFWNCSMKLISLRIGFKKMLTKSKKAVKSPKEILPK